MNRRKIQRINVECNSLNMPIVSLCSEKQISKNTLNLINEEVALFMFHKWDTKNKNRLIRNLLNTLVYEGKNLYQLPWDYIH